MRLPDTPAAGSVQPDAAPAAPRYRVRWLAMRSMTGGMETKTFTMAKAQARADKLNTEYGGMVHHWIEPVPAVEQAP